MTDPPLWAPWRIEWVNTPKDVECVLCKSQRLDPPDPASPLQRGQRCFAVLNAFPYAPGHLMIAPSRHVGELDDLDQQELSELMAMAARATRALRDVMAPGGFNIGLNVGQDAGAGVPEHLHLHVVPRWRGDTNFMPVLASTHVLAQALRDTYAALKQALDNRGSA